MISKVMNLLSLCAARWRRSLRAALFLAAAGAGCAQKTTADLDLAPVVHAMASFESALEAKLDANVDATVAAIADESVRVTETTQKAILAVNKTDNSTSDKVVNRAAVVALAMIALTYPVGKLIWLFFGLFRGKVKDNDDSQRVSGGPC